MSVKNDLLKAIQEQRDATKKAKFEGTLLDYMEYVKDNPTVIKSAHRRLYEAVEKHGIEVMPDSDPRKKKVFDGENISI
jgi:serine protein kinase